MNKDTFVFSLQALDTYFERTGYEGEVLSALYESFVVIPGTPLVPLIIRLLSEGFGEGAEEDINYFVYDLDFGKSFKMGSITQDGVDIDHSTAEKLWDSLVLQGSKKE